MGVFVPGYRPVWPGHRRPGVRERDLAATRWFFTHALKYGPLPTEVTLTVRTPTRVCSTSCCPPLTACHVTEQYTNNPIEADHGRLKSRLRPMRGLNGCVQRESSALDTPSSKTSAEATTSSVWVSTRDTGFQQLSRNSRAPTKHSITTARFIWQAWRRQNVPNESVGVDDERSRRLIMPVFDVSPVRSTLLSAS
jgi:hypothetical protein